jgi:hypothetical protein
MSGTSPPLPGPNPLVYPVVMTMAGVLPTPPATLLAQLIQLVTFGTDPTGAQVMQPDPGYTASLPGSLIEDVSSTDTAACVLMDLARVELINSLTPFGCNAFILNLLGQMFGIPAGQTTNMRVPIIFSGTVGYILQTGLQVSDGSHTYVLVQAGVVGSGGVSPSLTAVATVAGIWPIPVDSVQDIVTSIPSAITLTVNNAVAGAGGTVAETEQQYRLRVLQASNATCQGTPDFIKTLLMAVPGVVAQQVGLQLVGGLMKVICGGSNPDPDQIAGAIYLSAPDVGLLTGSVNSVESMTQANPGHATTLLNHGYATGQVVSFETMGGMPSLDTGTYTITVVNEKEFTIGISTSGIGPYTGGGVVLPNLRNNAVTINDYPDNYVIPWVTPPQQIVTVGLVWNAASAFESGAVLSQTAQGAIIAYINQIPVGAPINVLAMQEAVQAAVQPLLALSQLSRMVWTIAINGIDVSPNSGTYLYVGDPESYFFTSTAFVTVAQG